MSLLARTLCRLCPRLVDVCCGVGAGLGGAGISIRTTEDSLVIRKLDCTSVQNSTYRQWTYNTTVVISNSIVLDNNATCPQCSGGGITVLPGGTVTIANTTVAGNAAGFYGGGLFFGGSAYSGVSSCSVQLTDNTTIGNNTSIKGGAQLYR